MRRGWILPVVVVAVIVFLNSIYIVTQTQQALRLWFGEVTAVITKPGLYFKVPLLHEIVYYDNRILSLDTQPLEVTPLDDRRLVVDAFARWRIHDPVVFRKATSAGGEKRGSELLDNILKTKLRGVLGGVDSGAVLSADRVALMNQIRDQSRDEAAAIGIQVIDVRIKRADLPQKNLAATFERMRAERQRVAADEIARGNEAAQKVRAQADRTAVETTSEAQKQAEIIRGEADAKRNAVFAQAFGKDPEFFAFYRSLQAYKTALTGKNSTFVISPDSSFWSYMKGARTEPVPKVGPNAPAVPSALPTAGSGTSGSATGTASDKSAGTDATATPSAGQPASPPSAADTAEPLPSAPPATGSGTVPPPAPPASGTGQGG